jgi:hypothetical protein
VRFLILFFSFLYLSFPCFATDPSFDDFSPAAVIHKIEERRGNWIALKADLELKFENPSQGAEESCQGKMTYQRLDEKLLLSCIDTDGNLLFQFRSEDRDFEFYLPPLKTVFQGNIFQLEDSPKIQSHLRALDLYRSLKPMTFSEAQSSLKKEKNGNMLVEIRKASGNTNLRTLLVSEEGDVLEETYWDKQSKPIVTIRRSEFKDTKDEKKPFSFPRQILIESNQETSGGKGSKKTTLTFKNVDFLSDIDDASFALHLPKDTKKLVLADDLENEQAPSEEN